MSRHGKTAAMQRAREMAEAFIEANASVACAWAFDFGMNHEAFMLISLDYLLETRPLLEAVPISAMQREIRKRSGVRNDEVDEWRELLLAATAALDEPQMKMCQWQLNRAIHHMHMALSEDYRENVVNAALYSSRWHAGSPITVDQWGDLIHLPGEPSLSKQARDRELLNRTLQPKRNKR